MIVLKLTPEQAEILQAAVEVAMDNEGDADVYGEYADVQILLIDAQDKFYAKG